MRVHENDRRSRAGIFFQLMGHKPDWSYIHQISLTRKPNFDKIVSTESFWKIQAGSSIEFWISRSTKYENQMDFSEFSVTQNSNLMNKIGVWSSWKASESTKPSFQPLKEKFKPTVSEKDKMEHRRKS